VHPRLYDRKTPCVPMHNSKEYCTVQYCSMLTVCLSSDVRKTPCVPVRSSREYFTVQYCRVLTVLLWLQAPVL